jgi:hypothetical protein
MVAVYIVLEKFEIRNPNHAKNKDDRIPKMAWFNEKQGSRAPLIPKIGLPHPEASH